jgi:hypothetical protein
VYEIDVRLNVVGMSQGGMGSIPSVASGGGAGGSVPMVAGAGGGGGAVGAAGAVAQIAAGVGTALVVLEAMKMFLSKLVESSPHLQASMEIINKSLMLFLMPIGQLLDTYIRPLAIGMLQYAIGFYKAFSTPEGQEKLKQKITGMTAELPIAGPLGVLIDFLTGGKFADFLKKK